MRTCTLQLQNVDAGTTTKLLRVYIFIYQKNCSLHFCSPYCLLFILHIQYINLLYNTFAPALPTEVFNTVLCFKNWQQKKSPFVYPLRLSSTPPLPPPPTIQSQYLICGPNGSYRIICCRMSSTWTKCSRKGVI